MKTELSDKGALSTQLTILIEPEDYKDKFKKELKKHSQKAQIKGFRKGKVPITAIKKMYGLPVLSEVVNDLIQSTLQDVIVDKNLDILGNPIPSEDQEMVNLDPKVYLPYEFKFDMGLAPTFEVSGMDAQDRYDNYKILIAESDIDEQISDLQKRMGEQEEVEAPIEELDILALRITEESSEQEEPFSSEITIMPDRMTDGYKQEFLGKTVGYSTSIDIFGLEQNASDDHVRKYFLKDAPETVNKMFATEVLNIKRLVPADINEDFFVKAFGEESGIKDEAGARSKLKEDLATFYESQGLSITKRYMLERLIDGNTFELPDEFLKRWLKTSNEEITADQIEDEYAGFVKNLKWTLIKKEVSKKHELTIDPGEIKKSMVDKFKAQFAQYGYGAMGDMDFDSIGERMMQNQESVQKEYEELLAEKVLDTVIAHVSLQDKEVTSEEYRTIVEELQKNNR